MACMNQSWDTQLTKERDSSMAAFCALQADSGSVIAVDAQGHPTKTTTTKSLKQRRILFNAQESH